MNKQHTTISRTEVAIFAKAIAAFESNNRESEWVEVDKYAVGVIPESNGIYSVAAYFPGSAQSGECDLYATVDKDGEQVDATDKNQD